MVRNEPLFFCVWLRWGFLLQLLEERQLLQIVWMDKALDTNTVLSEQQINHILSKQKKPRRALTKAT